ncbi:NTP transferase domain-containing protein [candidate division KSB1 bacterium]|nr:NTP transferase domain-containing protein [candidate division KSB1 bacterium]
MIRKEHKQDERAPTLVVLAAGSSKRFGRMKQLESFGPSGEALLEYSLYDAHRAGFGKMLLVIQEEAELEFENHLSKKIGDRLDLSYVYQKTDSLTASNRSKPWGTGHAVLSAASEVEGSFAVINADDFYGFDALKKVADFLINSLDSAMTSYCLVGYRLADTLSAHGPVCRAICEINSEKHLLHLTEYTDILYQGHQIVSRMEHDQNVQLEGSQMVSMNCWGFSPDLFDYLQSQFHEFLQDFGNDSGREFFLPDVVNRLIQNGSAQVTVLPCQSSWFGVTYAHEQEQVMINLKECISNGLYPYDLWK